MKHQGIPKQTVREQAKGFANLLKIMRGDIVDRPKERKQRAKETKPRKQEEAEFRKNKVIPFYKKKAYAWFRIENKITGKHGRSLPDTMAFFSLHTGAITKDNMNEIPPLLLSFIELKSSSGRLSPEQEVFRDMVNKTVKVVHIEARTIEDIESCITQLKTKL